MYYVKVVQWFSAAHYLKDYPGKCQNMHGHNWKVIVTLRASGLVDGMVVDFKVLKAIVKLRLPDHMCLNEVWDFQPTAENIAKHLYDEIKANLHLTCIVMDSIEIWEGRDSCASYSE